MSTLGRRWLKEYESHIASIYKRGMGGWASHVNLWAYYTVGLLGIVKVSYVDELEWNRKENIKYS